MVLLQIFKNLLIFDKAYKDYANFLATLYGRRAFQDNYSIHMVTDRLEWEVMQSHQIVCFNSKPSDI